MKTLLIWLLSAAIMALLIATEAHGQLLPDSELDKLTAHDIERTRQHRITLTGEIVSLSDSAEELLRQQNGVLTAARGFLEQVRKTSEALQKHDAEQTALAITEHARADTEAKSNNRRGNILGWMGAALLGSLAFHFLPVLTKLLLALWPAAAPFAWVLPILAVPGGYFLTRMIL